MGQNIRANQPRPSTKEFGAIDVTKPYDFRWLGGIDGPKPYEFIGFGGKPNEFIRLGGIDDPKPYELIGSSLDGHNNIEPFWKLFSEHPEGPPTDPPTPLR